MDLGPPAKKQRTCQPSTRALMEESQYVPLPSPLWHEEVLPAFFSQSAKLPHPVGFLLLPQIHGRSTDVHPLDKFSNETSGNVAGTYLYEADSEILYRFQVDAVYDKWIKTIPSMTKQLEDDFSAIADLLEEQALALAWELLLKFITSIRSIFQDEQATLTSKFTTLESISGASVERLPHACSHSGRNEELRRFFSGHLRRCLPSCWVKIQTLALKNSLHEYLLSSAHLGGGRVGRSEAPFVIQSLYLLGFGAETGKIILKVARSRITAKIDQFRGDFESAYLSETLDFVNEAIHGGWIALLYSEFLPSSPVRTYANELRKNLANWARRELCSIRIEEIFDIVRTGALSNEINPVLQDLKMCLTGSFQIEELVESLKASVENRALHAGVATDDILTILVSMVHTLQVIDPSSNILLKVIGPTRDYLRRRPDTVRCILNRILDESSEIYEMIRQGDGAENPKLEAYDHWVPEAVDAAGSSKERTADLISRLTELCESQDQIVQEYQQILGESLLQRPDYLTEKQTMEIELLKRRFGENSFGQCEIMLMDVAASRRMDSLVHPRIMGDERTESVLHPLIVAHLFWPEIDSASFRIPVSIEAAKQRFSTQFKEQKPNRYLQWKVGAGLVTLEVQVSGETREFTVSELSAAVILAFEGRESLRTREIYDLLEVTEEHGIEVEKSLSFWVESGVLQRGDDDNFLVIEE
ncbi:hypothetical protein DFS34DRAFT_228064 [Phlyctochytrium arcticum]|nr:hypothetical protein DFS34DRAFT_228064 [Phlyctochytrium arcticum]